MRSVWAGALLLRRLGGERGIVLLIVVLVGATSFLFAAAPRAFNRAADEALRHAITAASPADRDVSLRLDASIASDPGTGVSGVRAFGDRLAVPLPPTVAALIAERTLRVTTVRMYLPDPPSYETHISLRYQDGLTDMTRLVAGHWPVDHGLPLRQVPEQQFDDEGNPIPPPVSDTTPDIFEVALSAATADEIGVQLGDHLAVTLDGSDSLVRGTPYRLMPTVLLVVGLYEPVDAGAAYWDGDPDLLHASQRGTEDKQVAWATAYVPAEMYPNLSASGLPFRYEWRLRVDPARFDASQIAQLQFDLHGLGQIAGVPDETTGETVGVITSLPQIVEGYAAERALAESVLSIATVGPFGLAGGAVAMVAILLARRRRATLTLARGRGASGALVLGTQLWEAILLAGGASAAGFLLAERVVPGQPTPLSALLSLVVLLLATLLLVGSAWRTARRPLGQLERDDPPVLRVSPRRLVIEMTVVAIAIGATVLLRQRGLTAAPSDASGSAGPGVGVDPLLASVPVLTGLAAGIVAIRFYPLPVRVLGWLAARRRELVPVLGLRRIGRQPTAANLPLLVLLLTAAFAAFSSVVVSSLDRGQLAASYLDVGADYRVQAVGLGALVPSSDPAGVPGVAAVAPGLVDSFAGFSTRPTQRSSIYQEIVDARAYEAVTSGTPVNPAWPSAFVAEPTGTGIGSDDNPIPAILSEERPYGSAPIELGDTFHMLVRGESMTFRLVEQRTGFPGIVDGTAFAIVPFDWVQAARGTRLLAPTIMWIRAPADAAGPIAADFPATRGVVHIVSRHDAYAALRDAPLSAAVALGYALALVIGVAYMALTIVGALILSAADRTRDLAYLRTLGVSGPQTLMLTVMEHAPPVLLAVVPGVVLGIGVAILCESGLGLATFVGAKGVPLFVDWPALVLIVVALVGVVAVAIAAATWLSRRTRLVNALRIGED